MQKFYIHLKWVKLPLLLVRFVFLPNLSKLPDLDETTARQVFMIAVIKPVAVMLGPFMSALGPIFMQNMALSQVQLTIQARQPH